MTGTGRAPVRRGRAWPLLAAALAALAAATTALVAAGALLVHPCLPGDGVVGSLGVRLALLAPDADCPVGTLALGADAPTGGRLVVLVVLPVLLSHLATALAGVSVLVAVRSGWRAVRDAVASLARRLPAAPAAPAPLVRATAPERPAVVVVRRGVGAVRRRGPPALLPV